MDTATARQIPGDIEEQCLELRQKIEAGADFAVTAVRHSNCPSAPGCGNPEHNHRGQSVPQCDRAVFQDEAGVVHDPLYARSGYNPLEVRSRQH